jgi:hypothetical protein
LSALAFPSCAAGNRSPRPPSPPRRRQSPLPARHQLRRTSAPVALCDVTDPRTSLDSTSFDTPAKPDPRHQGGLSPTARGLTAVASSCGPEDRRSRRPRRPLAARSVAGRPPLHVPVAAEDSTRSRGPAGDRPPPATAAILRVAYRRYRAPENHRYAVARDLNETHTSPVQVALADATHPSSNPLSPGAVRRANSSPSLWRSGSARHGSPDALRVFGRPDGAFGGDVAPPAWESRSRAAPHRIRPRPPPSAPTAPTRGGDARSRPRRDPLG